MQHKTPYYLQYTGLSKEEINSEFLRACQTGDLGVVKYLLTSSELPFNAEINHNDGLGFANACMFNRPELVRYLLTSPYLEKNAEIHSKNDLGFNTAYNNGLVDILEILIFDMDIDVTESMREYMHNSPRILADSMLMTRELNKGLGKNNNKNKTLKI